MFAANFALLNICIFTEPKLRQICIFNFAAIFCVEIAAFQIQKFAAKFAIVNICIFTEPKLKQICIFNFAAILGAENLNTKFTEKNRKINVFQKTDVSCVKIEAKQTQHCVIRVQKIIGAALCAYFLMSE